MGFYLDSQGNYYEGDRSSLADSPVPQRPSYRHKFTNGEWLEDVVVLKVEEAEKAKATLAELDMKSIRSIREWLVTQKEAPEIIKQLESDAIKEREKIEIWKTSSELTSSI